MLLRTCIGLSMIFVLVVSSEDNVNENKNENENGNDFQAIKENINFHFPSEMERSEEYYQRGVDSLYGNNTLLDPVRAFQYLDQSIAYGNAQAQFISGVANTMGLWGHSVNVPLGLLNYYFASLNGDIGAMMALGHRHKYGLGVPKNCESSLLYYEAAALKSIELRALSLVEPILLDSSSRRLTDDTRTGPADTEIVDYYHFSAEKGDESAAQNLATLYYIGARGVKQDFKKAALLFKKAADMGSYGAMACLGHMYIHGIGVQVNYDTAYELLKEAYEEGNSMAALNSIGYLYLHGLGRKVEREQAMKYFKKAAQSGNSNAMYNLGVIYMGGGGEEDEEDDEVDYSAAAENFQKAAQNGHTKSVHKLGLMHMHGMGRDRSCETATELMKNVAARGPWNVALDEAYLHFQNQEYHVALVTYLMMAEQGYEVAQHNAAYMIENEYGNEAKTKTLSGSTAVMLYRNAAHQGNVEANLKIGDFYYYGKGGVPISLKLAAEHYRLAGQRQNAQAMFNLGIMHEHGLGLPQDFHLAKRWYDLSGKASSDSYVPVLLALWGLNVHMKVVDWYTTPWFTVEDSTVKEPLELKHVHDENTITSYMPTIDTDTVVIVVLMMLLGGVLYYRSTRQRT